MPYAPEEWPIAVSMLPFAGSLATAFSNRSQRAEYWRLLESVWSEIRGAGFDRVELATDAVPVDAMDDGELAHLCETLTAAGLSAASVCVVRKSVIDEKRGDEYLSVTKRVISAARELSATHVAIGLHGQLSVAEAEAQWFWTVPGPPVRVDDAVRSLAIDRIGIIADVASHAGISISVETYDEGLLADADSAFSLIKDIDRSNLGINPDLGNLVRVQNKLIPWEYTVAKLLPIANYWHVKNYIRVEKPCTDEYFTAPSSLPGGVVNYRQAISYAVRVGFEGTILCEHYGGDSLEMAADHHRYLRRVLSRVAREATM